ncbi:MAG: hypothetical protein HY275_12320 [Gemmatimonadetes bacterium]|nr:hypothetical protein [Gemmatimonadota bacterium]
MAPAAAPPKLADIIRRLAASLGPPPVPFPAEPFALVLWEQVAYLADDATRLTAFRRLEREVGLAPEDIVHAKPQLLTAIARAGGAIAAPDRARRMVESAEIVLRDFAGDLGRALALPTADARKALSRFRMIGEPGADAILARCGAARLVPLDSNALRVVTRLGFVAQQKDYRRWYRAAREVVTVPRGQGAAWGARAGALLRRHGQQTCRARPDCDACVLRARCPSARPPGH